MWWKLAETQLQLYLIHDITKIVIDYTEENIMELLFEVNRLRSYGFDLPHFTLDSNPLEIWYEIECCYYNITDVMTRPERVQQSKCKIQ